MSFWSRTQEVDESEELKDLQETISKLENMYDEKLNPAQDEIAIDQQGSTQNTSRYSANHIRAYNSLEVVNRGVNIIADAVAEFTFDTKGRIPGIKPISTYARDPKVSLLLNHQASKYISSNELKRTFCSNVADLKKRVFVHGRHVVFNSFM